jgi:UDP-N-acetylmuramyl tripeptide synthase
MSFQLDEVRRLTGPNLLSDEPGAIADVLFSDALAQDVLMCWQKHLLETCDAVQWPAPLQYYHRFYDGGLSLSISAPMDLLYSACDVLELAWDLCVNELSPPQDASFNRSQRLTELKQSILEERHPALLNLLAQADAQGVICLADDDEVSLGTGPSAQTWTIDNLPDTDTIEWSRYKEIPLALITGTNGKSTSVRLAAEIAKAASINAGVTSTDFIKVGDTIIDEGDYSGPGGARMLLRDNRTEMAFLEVARGGLLRRGLPLSHAKAALVTNVASDHLGQYGINTVDEIAQVKTMVAKAIDPSSANANSILVLNADDPRLCDISKHLNVPICWFSPNKHNPMIEAAIANQQPSVYTDRGAFVYHHQQAHEITQIQHAPMTFNGTAAHNVQNALGVIGLCKALQIDEQYIKAGLRSFASSAKDNPGRGNMYELDGVKVIVDFAHNSHSMQAVMDMAAKMPAKNIHVMFSHAGDRSNQDIIEVANAVHNMAPTSYVLAELEPYLRGRELGEISAIVHKHLLSKGVNESNILLATDPLDGAKQCLARAESGDLVLLFVLSDRERVQALLS